MKYKGFIIEIEKVEEGGYSYLIYDENKWILADEWNECLKTKKDTLTDCKITVDDYYENPSYYKY